MAQLVLDDLEQSLVDAAKEAGGRQWEALRRRAMPELTNLAETAMEVEQRKLAGDSSERQAATLMRMHMRRPPDHNGNRRRAVADLGEGRRWRQRCVAPSSGRGNRVEGVLILPTHMSARPLVPHQWT